MLIPLSNRTYINYSITYLKYEMTHIKLLKKTEVSIRLVKNLEDGLNYCWFILFSLLSNMNITTLPYVNFYSGVVKVLGMIYMHFTKLVFEATAIQVARMSQSIELSIPYFM